MPETVTVRNVRATALAQMLTTMVSQSKRVDRRTGRLPVSIVGDDSSNTLLITANEADMSEMRPLVAKLDNRPEDADQRTNQG